jgi:hypothetical protein
MKSVPNEYKAKSSRKIVEEFMGIKLQMVKPPVDIFRDFCVYILSFQVLVSLDGLRTQLDDPLKLVILSYFQGVNRNTWNLTSTL